MWRHGLWNLLNFVTARSGHQRPPRWDGPHRAVLRSLGSPRARASVCVVSTTGVPAVQPGNHISARAQEFLLTEARQVDGRVALLEAVVIDAIQMGRAGAVHPDRVESHRVVGRLQAPASNADPNWAQLDQVSLEDIFSLRVPKLKSCPHFLRGRLRESFNFALRERFRAKWEGNVEAETRAWKLFGLIPVMLLHRPSGAGSVGRSELANQADFFARGLWTDLIQKAREAVPQPRSTPPPRTAVEEQVRRERAAQSRVQRGQVSRARQGVDWERRCHPGTRRRWMN